MAARKAMNPPAEPLGIVISNGDRDEAQPLFLAYVWGPVPEETAQPTSKKRVA